MARPDTATGPDDFVSRMLWALSDPKGLPAKRFAELNPVPGLDWLEPLGADRFGHVDLIRFGVPPKASADEKLAFSLIRRPSPYDLAPPMALANWGAHDGGLDDVMWHLTSWLIRHLGNPALLLWLLKQGGRLHAGFADRIAHRLDDLARLEHRQEHEELDRIRKDSPDAVPDERMRTLWGLLLAGRGEESRTGSRSSSLAGPLREGRPDNRLAAGAARPAQPARVIACALRMAVRRGGARGRTRQHSAARGLGDRSLGKPRA